MRLGFNHHYHQRHHQNHHHDNHRHNNRNHAHHHRHHRSHRNHHHHRHQNHHHHHHHQQEIIIVIIIVVIMILMTIDTTITRDMAITVITIINHTNDTNIEQEFRQCVPIHSRIQVFVPHDRASEGRCRRPQLGPVKHPGLTAESSATQAKMRARNFNAGNPSRLHSKPSVKEFEATAGRLDRPSC